MKLVTKKGEEPKTLGILEKELSILEKHVRIECEKCDGTGEPKTKTGKPPKSGLRNVRCRECGGTGMVGNKIDRIEDTIVQIRRELKRVAVGLRTHINKQSVEIRVLPEGGDPNKMTDWEDYTGTFELDNEEEKSIVIGKARLHFETYFKDAVYHRNKKLGIFLSNPMSGKHIIEEMETGE